MPAPIRPLFLAIGPWKIDGGTRELMSALDDRFTRAAPNPTAPNPAAPKFAAPEFLPRVTMQHGFITVDLLTATSLCAALDVAGRHRAWAFGLLINMPRTPVMVARRVLEDATKTPSGLAIRQERGEPSVAPVAAVLGLHLAILRGRSPTVWRAIDAAQRHGSAVAAARHLDVSHQAVSRQLRAGHARATAATPAALSAALAATRESLRH